ncbi:tyrosine-type recombinase/integrase [Streptomyces sp. NPDC093589]|uniref:tyrosine-type recombinase/integrase n=1 Tax=Streptomyces sp. NPDC093589 TaxID=3366043 RepID=UPI00382EF204
MNCDRDRALLEIFVSSGARAEELLGITAGDIDWSGQRIYVITKGTRAREAVPVSPQGLFRLALYLDAAGTPAEGEPVWRVRRGQNRPLTYWALRRVMQRTNTLLGTNWSLHDLRHSAAYRMANGGKLTLPEVQTIMRHADIQTTNRYLAVHVEELFDKLTEHYATPRPARHYPAGYAAADIEAVFGGWPRPSHHRSQPPPHRHQRRAGHRQPLRLRPDRGPTGRGDHHAAPLRGSDHRHTTAPRPTRARRLTGRRRADRRTAPRLHPARPGLPGRVRGQHLATALGCQPPGPR